jgi:ABC-type spermidine/putrescine transport system permease subunit II
MNTWISRTTFLGYLVLFFGFLLGPLLVMGISAFNTPSYPQAYPFEGFTLRWFGELFGDDDMMVGLRTSLWIGIWVTLISVPTGLAGAIVMTSGANSRHHNRYCDCCFLATVHWNDWPQRNIQWDVSDHCRAV